MKTRMKTLKAFVLFLGLLMLTATQMNAQNKGGGLFGMGPSGEASPHRSLLNPSGGNITNQTYGSDADGFGITNQTYGQDAPLGSGLLIMAVAGACYAGMKRNKKQKGKTMRKYNFILMAFALLLGMAQCKKEPSTPNGDNNGGVRITLKVNDGESGEKLNVYPATGAVIFTQGDKIYVGNNGKYVGTLTFDNGLFQGTVSGDLSTNDYLHFYFVGNKPTTPSTLGAGTTTYTVDISNQSAGLPAISYAPSTAKYSPSTTAYTAKLLNKSALVKFVPSTATSQPITVSGLNNKVQIDFASHTLVPTGNTGGITLFSAGESEKWAVLLEQASLSGLTVSVYGYNATIDGTTLPSAITNNMYYNTGIGVSMTAAYQTFVVNSSSSDPSVVSFNNAASIPTPKLYFETNYGDGLTLTRANGIVDFNGHSANELFIQNDEEGESITLQNGTISPKPIDGSNEGGVYYKGTVILENMTVTGNYAKVFTDGHAYIINSGTYNQKICCDTYSSYPGTTTIYGGYFTELGFNSGPQGTFILYGGKYKTRPDNAWCAEGYTIKSNTDSDSGTYPWVVCALPEGALRGEFTINGSGGKVFFSKGNLQYIGSASTPYWKFAEHQWDYLGDNGQGGTAANVDRDLFCFGASGYQHGAAVYQPWGHGGSDSYHYAYGVQGNNLNDGDGRADWGYNAIQNGGNRENIGWRTLSKDEWLYLLNTRSTTSGIRYAKAKVNDKDGIVVLPDTWDASIYAFSGANTHSTTFNSNVISLDTWNNNFETNGAVFLPVSGWVDKNDNGPTPGYNATPGAYWSSTAVGSPAWYFDIYNTWIDFSNSHDRGHRRGVRLVLDVQ